MSTRRASLVLSVTAAAFVAGAAAVGSGGSLSARPAPVHPESVTAKSKHSAPSRLTVNSTAVPTAAEIKVLDASVKLYCQTCHNARRVAMKNGVTFSMEEWSLEKAPEDLEITEKIVRKLRTEMMPPPTSRKPKGDSLAIIATAIENIVDKSTKTNPGTRVFQRLNRPEYERAVRDLLGVQIIAGDYLPLDTKSANFDNIADVQSLSPTLLDSYLNAASAVSRMAIGDKSVIPIPVTYRQSPFVSQHPWDYVEGAPYGTRGGIVATHTFPADGMYIFRVNVGGGVGTKFEDVDVSVDGSRIALLHYEKGVERTFASADAPQGADFIRAEPVFVKAGQKRISAAFARRSEGPYEDLIKPHEWSMASNGNASAGTTAPPHIVELSVIGPEKVTGISETPSRKLVFSCYPKSKAQEAPCATSILTRLATRAYRRPATAHDVDGLMRFYREGSKTGGFDEGIRLALQAMLANPYFVFRFEKQPANIADGKDFKISDIELASRLSFFLWGSIPDQALLAKATAGTLSQPAILSAEVKRMLADPKSEALASRFAGQWLRLQDLEKVHPDAFFFPDYDQQLADAMIRETELFFTDVVRRDRPVTDLFTADWTFANERLARHYGIPNVSGTHFRRVMYPDSTRRGVLGHGSILVQTSLANRTSPVLRGKWVMEVLLNSPPPPPPDNVPALEETAEGKDGRALTTRERMIIHRSNPTCNACHQYMDPIGLALDNFDVTAKWRYRENGAALDTRGNMWDGKPVSNPTELLGSLMARPIPLVRAFTENLTAYALGRRVEDSDQPLIRKLARDAEKSGNKFSAFVTGIVNSPAFRTRRADVVADDAGPAGSSTSPRHHNP
jgi:hypothetical protein